MISANLVQIAKTSLPPGFPKLRKTSGDVIVLFTGPTLGMLLRNAPDMAQFDREVGVTYDDWADCDSDTWAPCSILLEDD